MAAPPAPSLLASVPLPNARLVGHAAAGIVAGLRGKVGGDAAGGGGEMAAEADATVLAVGLGVGLLCCVALALLACAFRQQHASRRAPHDGPQGWGRYVQPQVELTPRRPRGWGHTTDELDDAFGFGSSDEDVDDDGLDSGVGESVVAIGGAGKRK